MNRIYHNHLDWEEVKDNMYGSYDNKRKEEYIQKIIYYFKSPKLVEYYMDKVIQEYRYSCEHNFTNPNLNKIAWLGQASVAIYLKLPEDLTRIAWSYLTEEEQNIANNIAIRIIKRWEKCQKNI